MADRQTAIERDASKSPMSHFRFPSAYTILFVLIMIVAGLTWIIPAGQYDRIRNDVLDKDVPVPGTYQTVDANPQDVVDVFLAPIAGFYKPDTYEANAVDVAVFVLIIGGFLGVVTRTGAINAGIARTMTALEGREMWMIPILMALFAAGGTTYGMAEETLAFYMLIIPVVIAAGYDALTGVAIILLGAGIGVLGSTINPFATVIAANAAGIPFTDGMVLRLVLLVAGWLLCVGFVMRYAERVRRNPSLSLVADLKESNEVHFLRREDNTGNADFTLTHKVVLSLFGVTFGIMIWGVSTGGWWMAEMSALFLASAVIVGVVARMGEQLFTETFVSGAKELLGVALIIAIARGIVVIMDAGNITDTILHWSEQAVSGLGQAAFINMMYWIEVGLSFLIPSTSGLAVVSMPIMAPLAEFSDVSRALVVTAYQSAAGIVNLITPTSAVVMGGLAIGRVPYERWLHFIWPLLLALTVLIMTTLTISV